MSLARCFVFFFRHCRSELPSLHLALVSLNRFEVACSFFIPYQICGACLNLNFDFNPLGTW